MKGIGPFGGRLNPQGRLVRLSGIILILAWLLLSLGKGADAASPPATPVGGADTDKVVVLADHIRLNRNTSLLHANGHAYISATHGLSAPTP
jgi:hypothetical protein